jgi:NADPH-dependent curcumin reductase CurA
VDAQVLRNRRVLFVKRPVGEADDSCFRLEQVPVPELREGQILIKTLWLSVDPYMRGRMNATVSYAKPLMPGEIMIGETAGAVLASRSASYQPGDYVTAHKGWQSLIVAAADEPSVRRVDVTKAPLTAYLGAAGMTGRTAYFGLLEVGKPRAGETLVVSSAAGAVGSVAGQIGLRMGLRVIGIAGGPEKCRYVTEVLGFHACIDYKGGNLPDALRAACPRGIDIYFENVGGDVTRAVAPLLNPGARVPICGYISDYNAADLASVERPADILGKLDPVPEHRFFVVTEWMERWPEATAQLCEWIAAGRLRYREAIGTGLEHAPQCLRDVLHGRNFGKQLVKVAAE